MDAWNAWRRTTAERPDFSGELLQDVSLIEYNLAAANFSNGTLFRVSFRESVCDDASFENASLLRVLFHETSLTNCSFRNASIGFSSLQSCKLSNSDFARALIFGSSFSQLSLEGVRGLEHLRAAGGRNSIGIDTFFESGGVPEAFLRNIGVPEQFVEYAASLTGKAIEYYSCFLSYSSKDDEFARRLYNDLQGKNIRTWFAPEDLKIGDRFRMRIDESIRVHDKLALILSEHSVASDWVESEVESALERERREGRDVLFPIAIDDAGFESQQPWAKDIRLKRHIGDFRRWKSHDDYTRAFERLVRDLKKSQPSIIMRG